MKKLLLSSVIILMTAGSALAHCGVCGVGDAKESKGSKKNDWMKSKMQMMTNELGLSKEQATKVESIMQTKMEKKDAASKKAEKEMEKIYDQYKEDLSKTLTPEQMKKYDAMISAHKKGSMTDKDIKGSRKSHDHKGSHHEKKGS